LLKEHPPTPDYQRDRRFLQGPDKAANEEYYNKCLTELKKNLDAQLKHEMTIYWAGKWSIKPADSGTTTTSKPKETISLPPDSAPPTEASLVTLISHLSD
jgi:hypothetical protein